MIDESQIRLASIHDKDTILQRLDRVLDPELDQSVVQLGFVEAITAENGHVTIETQFPTSWCSPNFAYMMAQDMRHELLSVSTVQGVTVRVKDNVMSKAIEDGVNSGKTFSEAFDDDDSENLGELRGLFLRKGYVKRQEALLRRLRDAGVPFEDICALRIQDVSYENGVSLLTTQIGEVIAIEPDTIARDYLERRARIELDYRPESALFVELSGEPVSAAKMEEYLIYARTVRISMEANGSLCSALLAATKTRKQPIALV